MAHLTHEQRYTIDVLLKRGKKKKEIAVIIGKHPSVIGREISRNKDQRSGQYDSDLAQRKCCKRMKEKPKYIRFTASVKARVKGYLDSDYSPEQITGRCRRDKEETVSHETIYQYIWEDKKQGGSLHVHLRRQGRHYRKRGSAKDSRGILRNRVGIEKRPEEVERRNRFGDLEGDLIIGKNHKQAIVTLNDRSVGMLKIRKVNSKEAWEVEKALTEMISQWLPYDVRTLTLDNGKEFADHEKLAENTGVDVYFARPYHSWERGSNENLNGLIRQYFPKGTDFTLISEQQLQEVENKLNNRPRKRYDFDTPMEKMDKLLFNQKVAFVT